MQTLTDPSPSPEARTRDGLPPWLPPRRAQPEAAAPRPSAPAAPRRPRWRALRAALARHALLLVVLVPTALSALYYGLIASDVYLSESRFVVRSASRPNAGLGLASMLQGAGLSGLSRAGDDSYAVHDFILSRDAMRLLDREFDLRTAYGAPHLDRLSRFAGIDPDTSIDALYRYHTRQLDLRLDSASAISTLTVNAFDASTAHGINDRLLRAAETFVNELNERARADTVQYAERELAAAEQRAREAALALARFRNERSVADPERQTGLQLAQVSKLQDDLIATQGAIAQLRLTAPDSPQLAGLQARAAATQRAIERENAKITGGNSLASKSADYQRVALEQELANRQLAAALAALQDARNDAQRKRLYLERIAQPNQPEVAERPRRLRNVLSVFVVCTLLAACLSVILAGVREHRA